MYRTEDLLKTAKEAILKNKLIFIEDIIAFLPCHKSTFYEHFPNESDNYKTLVDMLETNRTTIKVSLRKKWYDSDNATLQMGLMKLIANPEEHRRLSQTHQEHSGEIKTVNLTDEEVKKINNNLEQSY